MFLDDDGHAQWSGLSEYCTAQEAVNWQAKFSAAVPEVGREILNKWVAAKVAYDANRQNGDPLSVGLAEARKAFVEAK